MKKNFTKKFILENSGCYNDEDVAEYWPKGKTKIHLNDILNSGIKIKDKYWFVCRKLATKKQNITIAICIAEIVLRFFGNKCKNDKISMEAIDTATKTIEAARKYLKIKSRQNANIAISAVVSALDIAKATYSTANTAANPEHAAAYADYAAVTEVAAYVTKSAVAEADPSVAAYASSRVASCAINTVVYSVRFTPINNTLLEFLIDFCNYGKYNKKNKKNKSIKLCQKKAIISQISY